MDLVDGLDRLDWSDLGGQWIVVDDGQQIAGCVQLLPGKPIGRAENLAVDPALSPRQRARVVSMLIRTSIMLLRRAGCGAIISAVPDDLDGYQTILERRGAVSLYPGQILIKRLV
ncbi:MAG: hypothetical protein AB7Q01_15015 [Gammaproteobacteria bacterium]